MNVIRHNKWINLKFVVIWFYHTNWMRCITIIEIFFRSQIGFAIMEPEWAEHLNTVSIGIAFSLKMADIISLHFMTNDACNPFCKKLIASNVSHLNASSKWYSLSIKRIIFSNLISVNAGRICFCRQTCISNIFHFDLLHLRNFNCKSVLSLRDG